LDKALPKDLIAIRRDQFEEEGDKKGFEEREYYKY
tara:strand:+ start:161 stop:265 length:105 start_codon:yes stop_codon:yes gene_type:complete